jgi:hypothetical protein
MAVYTSTLADVLVETVYQYHSLLAALCAGLETDSTSGQLGPDPTLCGSVCVSSGTKVPLGD